MTNIDYIPIFNISKELLLEITNTKENNDAIETLFNAASFILNNRTALKHDLMGRIYHKLLVDAKYFGAFYTMIPSAVLLTELTFDHNFWNVDFTNRQDVEKIKIGDLACGTGTLLKSSLEAVIDNYIELTILNGNQPDIKGFTKSIIENNIYGYDVLPFAAHLAASTLALHEPDVSFDKMNLFYLPIGGKELRLGSLDFLSDRKIPIQTDLFGSSSSGSQVTGEGDKSLTVEIPKLDLCIMNPPFTRSVGGNLLFGSYPTKQRTKMQNKLKKIIKDEHIHANITAGLGSAFIALADKRLNRNGHLSLILPKTVLSGDSWRVSRKIISKRYKTRYIIVSHEPYKWNFSENTMLSECMIVADGNKNKNLAPYCYMINLLHRPTSNVEAYVLASIIKTLNPVGLYEEGTTEIKIEDKKIGEIIKVPSDVVMENLSMVASAFLQTDLIRFYYYFNQNKLYIPSIGIISDLQLVTFDKLFTLGFDQRDIHDGFEKTNSKTIFPSFWGHDNEKVLTIHQDPNQFLNQLSEPKPGLEN